MRITYKGDYALKTMLDMAIRYDPSGNSVVTIHDLAKRLDIPIKFLEQILLDLKRAGFVESRRGKVGGYHLARRPAQIKLGDVIRFIDGPIEPIACVEKKYSGCNDIYRCVFRKTWQEVSKAISSIVDTVTLEDLANQVRSAQKTYAYSI